MSVQEQVYELVKVHPNFEIRKYPDVICAIATMSESDYSGSSESFRRIAKYIFGQNDRSMKIAMTSPVQRWNDEDGSKMASKSIKNGFPSPFVAASFFLIGFWSILSAIFDPPTPIWS